VYVWSLKTAHQTAPVKPESARFLLKLPADPSAGFFVYIRHELRNEFY